MKIFIPSRGRAHNIETHKILEGANVDYNIVVATKEEKKIYVKQAGISPSNIIVSGARPGITPARQWIIDQVKKNEWFAMLDDRILYFRMFAEPYYSMETLTPEQVLKYGNKDRKNGPFMLPVDGTRVVDLFDECVDKAEEIGSRICGFSVIDNPMYRRRKWRHVAYVSNRMVLVKKGKIDFDPVLSTMEECGFFAEHLVRYGRVLVNSYVWPQKRHYEKGGIGTYNERFPLKILESIYLAWKYPGLIGIKNRKNKPANSEVQVLLRNEESVKRWRAAHGYGKRG